MIKIDKEYSIDIDSLNFVLQYRRPKEVEKNGEIKTVTEKSDWYFPSIHACLRKYLDESMRECESIEKVLSKIDEVHETIRKLKLK